MGIINEEKQGSKVILFPTQRLDTTSSPELEEKIRNILRNDKGINTLVIDLSKTTYISSLGLRVMLQGLKWMKNSGGQFFIQNINPQIESIFEMAGLMELLVREEKLVVLQKSEARARVVMSLEGKLSDETAGHFEEEIKLVAEKYASIYLDCAHLSFISNNGYRSLTTVHNYILDKGGSLILQNLSDRVKQVISNEKLDKLFDFSSVNVSIQDKKAVVSLIGCIDDTNIKTLYEETGMIMQKPYIKELCFYVEKVTYISKTAIAAFMQIYKDLEKKGIALKVMLSGFDLETPKS
ncbi:MAG: anti-sigma factor antagonist [Spirochaetaceae bacterium]|nr:anti-sigma factor antagonist [Spirochaetaceae bacterium]